MGVDIQGVVEDVVVRGNRIIDTRQADPGRLRIGIRIAPDVLRPVIEGNAIQGMEQDVEDQRKAD